MNIKAIFIFRITRNKFIKIGEVSIKTGKYGPYFQFKGKNYNIPKSYNPDTLTMNDIQELVKKKKEYLKKKESN